MQHFEWRILNDDCIALFMKNVMYYNLKFDQHESIECIEFEGGPSVTMEEMVEVEGTLFQVIGIRDIVKIDLEQDTYLLHHPFDVEVRLEAQKLL
jgi:hypothetical protein